MHFDSAQGKLYRDKEEEAKQLSMKILAKVGGAVRAESFISIRAAHIQWITLDPATPASSSSETMPRR